jgi:hypothetical protein
MRSSSSRLAVCCLVVLVVLAGCGGNSSDPGSASPRPTETVTTAATAETTATPYDPAIATGEKANHYLEAMRGRGVGLRSVGTSNGSFQVRFDDVDGPAQRDNARVLVSIIYGDLVNDTWTSADTWAASRMDAVAVDEGGRPVWSFRVPAYWARLVADGTIPLREFVSRVENATEQHTTATAGAEDRPTLREDVTRGTNATVIALDRVGQTAFLTVETETTDAALRPTLQTITTAYGETATEWNTTALEVTIQRPDGDLYGWYRVDASVARNVAAGNATVPGGVLGGVSLETDALEPGP